MNVEPKNKKKEEIWNFSKNDNYYLQLKTVNNKDNYIK